MSAKGKYYRSGTKGGGKSKLPKDSGQHMVPGNLGGESQPRRTQGRTGYCEEKMGTGGKGRPIPLPKSEKG
jgi:hypothetical protein